LTVLSSDQISHIFGGGGAGGLQRGGGMVVASIPEDVEFRIPDSGFPYMWCPSGGGKAEGTPYNGLYGEAPPG